MIKTIRGKRKEKVLWDPMQYLLTKLSSRVHDKSKTTWKPRRNYLDSVNRGEESQGQLLSFDSGLALDVY
ncbi:hypothetical protein Tco_0953177 [Tanacetum coccineum]|uniref:Uncharacterized protein n=1 Tax=Tanacetum coccineum TaxID=301880 RepID=A0ABQ5E1E9_9ASTR